MAYLDRTDDFIQSLGVEAYRVGGSVRDELLGRRVKDADYMVRGETLHDLGYILQDREREFTDLKISPLSLRDGRQAGWRVAAKGLGLIEIVLPRTEVPRTLTPEEKLQAGGVRRAFDIVVDPTVTLSEDAKRRDFTFNALYKQVGPDRGEAPADPTGTGLYDLQHRFIRTTHPDSFRDDPLRTLRALRFVSTLGYELSADTREQMTEHADAVNGLSAKGYASGTVLSELSKLLMGQYPANALRLMRDTGVMAVLLPELAPMIGFDQSSRYHDMTTDEHTFKAIETAAHVDAPLRVRMALLFHDSGKPETAWIGKDGHKHYYATVLQRIEDVEIVTEDHEVVGARIWEAAADRLGAERTLKYDVSTLIQHHMVTVTGKIKPPKVRRLRVLLGDSMLRDLYLHRMCDVCGKGKPSQAYLERLGMLEKIRAEAEAAKVPASVKDLAINGHDLKNLGADGRKIGDVLRAVLDEVVCQPNDQLRSRDWQLERAHGLL